MRLIDPPELQAMWDKCKPYLSFNTTKKRFKEGTPEEIKELYKEYLRKSDRLYDEEVADMLGYSSVDEYYKVHPERELKDIDLE